MKDKRHIEVADEVIACANCGAKEYLPMRRIFADHSDYNKSLNAFFEAHKNCKQANPQPL